METRTEVMFGQDYDDRVDRLRDMDVLLVMDLLPEEDRTQPIEILIELIIENNLDKEL